MWQSIFTTGVLMLGVHMETTPLEWPRFITPFQGFCRITSQVPMRVLCCATIAPVLVSYTHRFPVIDAAVQSRDAGEAWGAAVHGS